MAPLFQIQEAVRARAGKTVSTYPEWPCRKGCDDCCRSLASAPRVTEGEWLLISAAVDALPAAVGGPVRQRIRESGGAARPVVCPLLDAGSGACLIYEARPVACRTYGFYAERESVLGCARIESIARESPDVVWGNHTSVEERLRLLGPAAGISEWLSLEDSPGRS